MPHLRLVPRHDSIIDVSDFPSHVLPHLGHADVTSVHSPDHHGPVNLVTATITAAASLFTPEQAQFLIVDTRGGDVFTDFLWLPHVAGVFSTSDDPEALTEARDTVAGLLDSREDDLPDDSRVYVIVNGADDPRGVPELAQIEDMIDERGDFARVFLVRSRF